MGRQELTGTWQAVSYALNGEKASDEVSNGNALDRETHERSRVDLADVLPQVGEPAGAIQLEQVVARGRARTGIERHQGAGTRGLVANTRIPMQRNSAPAIGPIQYGA